MRFLKPSRLVLLCSLLALVVAGGFGPPAVQAQPSPTSLPVDERPTNIIVMIPDGFGPASATLARDYLRATTGRQELVFDSLHVGSTRTASSDSRITDSAAAGTALSTGHKTYNGAIAVDSTGQPVSTVLEAAEARGMATGLVVTSRLTHATPAVYSAHVTDRSNENTIARQQIGAGIEVLLGGGRRHFLPEEEGGRRTDGENLLSLARNDGYQVVQTPQALRTAAGDRLLGLFADGHMSYEIDRDSTRQPSLAAMTRTSLDRLADDPDGFFLMVEGSRVDHAGHSNDPAAHLHDILAFEDAVAEALDFARSDGETLVLVLSDHETGGLSVGRNRDGSGIYQWHPRSLASVTKSHGAMVRDMMNGTDPASVLASAAGIDSLRSDEQALLADADGDRRALYGAVSEIIGRRSLVGWTSLAHTAVDVSTYAYGPGWQAFIGSHENTYIGETLARMMDANLTDLTQQLRRPEPASSSR